MAGASFGAFCALQIDGATMGKVIVIMLPLGILFTVLTGGFKLTEGELPKDHFWLRVVLIGVLIGFMKDFLVRAPERSFDCAACVFKDRNGPVVRHCQRLLISRPTLLAFMTFASGAPFVMKSPSRALLPACWEIE